ncbi:hypothetical protein CO660_05425 [Rhizobium sp. L9]|uniref:DUF982 domain-containing protein n=1 Tax=Rhizobium sp. L9 TaxID=1340738 RepID=UPI000BE9C3B2|nr:DUF982 domain-containing protein [Rhizobium sp. L9]PDT31048.1 hypothetical protein CO660_05425 [Rhizobium sp. L9]
MPAVGLMNWHKRGDFPPLSLVIRGQANDRLIRSLADIADVLIAGWPTDDGEEYVAAVKTCVDAIQGNISAKVARAALVRAAEGAGIPVVAVVH